jgi:phospholipid N-methyltransferase
MAFSPSFLRGALRHFKEVSTVFETSPAAAKQIVASVDGSVRRVIMEYGPGTGSVTKELLKPGKLTDDSKLILVELLEEYVKELRQTITDPRVTIVHDSAENAAEILHECGEEAADYILLSIPLSTMVEETRERILRIAYEILKPSASLIVFLIRRKNLEYIRKVFGSDVTAKKIFPNIPPLWLFEAKKSQAS